MSQSRLPLVASALLLPATLFFTPPHGAEAVTSTPSQPLPTTTAPAVARDSGEALRQALLSRLEFEELNLQLVGVASFGGQTSAFIKHPGASEHMTYHAGDVIGGYRVASINPSMVTFERDGFKFYLAAGESSSGPAAGTAIASEPSERQPVLDGAVEPESRNEFRPVQVASADGFIDGPALEEGADTSVVAIKTADDTLKLKTSRFGSVKLADAEVASRGKIHARKGSSRSDSGSFFANPLTRSRFSSGFGYRKHPIGGGRKFHHGVDLAAPAGTPVHAAADGIVTTVKWTPTLGRYVTVEHANGFSTRYGHLSSQSVKKGQRVRQGDVVGKVGSTGQSTGNHLHFEVRKNSVALNPESYVDVR